MITHVGADLSNVAALYIHCVDSVWVAICQFFSCIVEPYRLTCVHVKIAWYSYIYSGYLIKHIATCTHVSIYARVFALI